MVEQARILVLLSLWWKEYVLFLARCPTRRHRSISCSLSDQRFLDLWTLLCPIGTHLTHGFRKANSTDGNISAIVHYKIGSHCSSVPSPRPDFSEVTVSRTPLIRLHRRHFGPDSERVWKSSEHSSPSSCEAPSQFAERSHCHDVFTSSVAKKSFTRGRTSLAGESTECKDSTLGHQSVVDKSRLQRQDSPAWWTSFSF